MKFKDFENAGLGDTSKQKLAWIENIYVTKGFVGEAYIFLQRNYGGNFTLSSKGLLGGNFYVAEWVSMVEAYMSL